MFNVNHLYEQILNKYAIVERSQQSCIEPAGYSVLRCILNRLQTIDNLRM